MDPFIGQIQPYGFNFAPRSWALCDGQLMAISSNTALFSLLGTTFGGDGRTTFALPDLRGRSIVHVGRGPGLSTITWGQKGGSEQLNIRIQNLPSHSHTQLIPINDDEEANTDDPNNAVIGNSGNPRFYPNPSTGKFLRQSQTSNVGNSQPINIRNPFLGIYVCIALFGIFPSRS